MATAPAGEAELAAYLRQALSKSRFEQIFAAGARLNLHEAVAAIHDRPHASARVS